MNTKISHQVTLEQLFSKNQLIPRIKAEFTECKEFNFATYIQQQGIPLSFGLDLLVQMALHKRADMSTMVGVLRHHFQSGQECADMLLKAAMADLIDWAPDLRIFIVKFTISDDVQEELDRFQFPLPMVIEPKEITSNRDTGYMLNKGSVILKKNHHDDDVCLDHLNKVNRYKLCINNDTATMVKNRWRNLDKQKVEETKEDFHKRKRAFEKYDRTAKDVIELLTQEDNEFYLTHKYDKRGRVYCQGYHVNYQGTPWNKAVVEFKDKEYLT